MSVNVSLAEKRKDESLPLTPLDSATRPHLWIVWRRCSCALLSARAMCGSECGQTAWRRYYTLLYITGSAPSDSHRVQ